MPNAIMKAAPNGLTVTKAILSSETPDRDHDVVVQRGVRLDTYRTCPVVLAFHDTKRPPVGKSITIGVEGGKLTAVPEWVPEELCDEQNAAVVRLVKGGWMTGCSIGFSPVESAPRAGGKGHVFKSVELFEWSVLGIPSQSEALLQAKGFGINVDCLREDFERLADDHFFDFVPRESRETVTKALSLVSTRKHFDMGGAILADLKKRAPVAATKATVGWRYDPAQDQTKGASPSVQRLADGLRAGAAQVAREALRLGEDPEAAVATYNARMVAAIAGRAEINMAAKLDSETVAVIEGGVRVTALEVRTEVERRVGLDLADRSRPMASNERSFKLGELSAEEMAKSRGN